MDDVTVVVPHGISAVSVDQFRTELMRAADDDDTRCIFLVGQDGQFCSGLDFAELIGDGMAENWPGLLETEIKATVQAFADCLSRLRFSNKPTIAIVDGPARGGGVGMAAACDLVLASERAAFALPEVLFGLMPAVIRPFLQERMTIQKIRIWSLTGEGHSAAEARAAGLVDEVVEPDALPARAKRWSTGLSRAVPDAALALKRNLSGDSASWSDTLEKAVDATSRALCNVDVAKGLRAFVEDGTPPWGIR